MVQPIKTFMRMAVVVMRSWFRGVAASDMEGSY